MANFLSASLFPLHTQLVCMYMCDAESVGIEEKNREQQHCIDCQEKTANIAVGIVRIWYGVIILLVHFGSSFHSLIS